ncbi:MAG: S-layer homology domain-containing protein [Megasphaera elsdenii]|nr:S-layer homology domain-containing protein [Megasphaera elsdenii]
MNENSIALGKDTKANNAQQAVSVAIGENAEASGERSLAIGFGVSEKVNGQDDTTLTSTKASGESAIAIGTDVVAQGQHSVAMGSHTDAAKDSSVAIGFDTHTVSDSAVAIGSGTRAEGRYSVALGLSSVAGKETNDATNPLNGGDSVAIGYGTSAKASRSVAIGTGATAADAEFTTALGDSANAQQRGSVAIGAGSVATRAAGNKEGGTEYKEAYLIPDVSKATDVEKATWTSTEGAVSVGGTAKYQEYDENGNKGTKTKLLTRQITNVAAGSLGTDAVNVAQLRQVQTKHTQVTVEGGTDAGTTAKDGTRTYTGTNLKLNQLTDQNGATVYDLKLADTVTIGGKDGADGTNGVDGHIGVRGKDGEKGANGRDAVSIDGKDGNEGHIGLKGKDGEKGKDGQNAYSDITTHFGPATLNPDKNVKIIKDDVETDAATRLHYVDQNNKEHEVGTMDDGQKYAGDFGDGASVKLNKTVTIKGKVKADAKEDDFVDGNIAVVANKKGEDGELLIKLNKDLTGLNSATYTTSTKNGDVTTTSTTVVDGTGLKIENGPSITNTGIDGGSKKITNVADGEISATSKDAVNGSQLNDVKNLAEQHTTVEAGPSGNVTVTPGTNADGSKKYTVDLAKDVTFGDTAKGDKTVAISGTDGTITAGTGDNKVTVDGSKGQIVAGGNNGVKIGNIENGDSSLTIYDKDSKATGKTDKAGKYVTNLDNKTWKDDGSYVSGRAATEDQLHQVESNVNKQIADVNTKIDKVDKHHTEVTVNGGTAAKADGSYTDGNLQIAQKTGSDGQKIYDLKLSDNLNIGGAGKDGKDGQNGHMGINGADGKSGIGIDGEDGISIKGKDGKDGVTIKGIDGKNGTEGHIGLTGSAGKDGQNASADIHVKNGQVGVDGTDGHGGKDGMDRVVYEDHNHVTHEVATMDDGMKYSGDSGKAAVKLNKNVQVYGGATEYADGNNIGVVASQDGDNAKLQVKLAKDFKGINSIEAKTITTGDTTMDNSGLTVKGDGNHKDITIHQGNVNMGGNKVSGVADGKVSQDSTDAVNGSQLWQRDQAINGLSGSVNKLGNRINRVGAGAAALAALHPLDFDPDDKWDFAAGYGNYRGANAAAVGAYYRPNEDTMFSVGGSFGGGENMVNAGVSIKLGQGNHVSTSRVAMAKEMKAMRQHMAEQDALIAKLQSMHGMAVDPAKSTLFPDVAENHWAYQYVTTLAKKGILEGYPDGEFKGDRMMTRYEFAAIVYRIVESGVGSTDPELSKLVKEFSPELQYIRIDTIQKDRDGKPTIERVRVISDAK